VQLPVVTDDIDRGVVIDDRPGAWDAVLEEARAGLTLTSVVHILDGAAPPARDTEGMAAGKNVKRPREAQKGWRRRDRWLRRRERQPWSSRSRRRQGDGVIAGRSGVQGVRDGY